MEYGNKLNDGNYEKVLNYSKNYFKSKSEKDMKVLSNSDYNESSKIFKVKFINENLYIKYPSGEVYYDNGCRYKNIPVEILLLRFLANAKGIPITNKYITYKEVDGGYVYYSNFQSRTIKEFIKAFGDNIEGFDNAMEKLGALKLDFGDSSYKLNFINDTYIIFIIWEGDDEIHPNGNILFDKNIEYYFNAEDLAVAVDIALDKVKKMV